MSTLASTSFWVKAELSDVHSSHHCYAVLLEKDDNGAVVASLRCTIWASRARTLLPRFEAATGQRFASGVKVLLHGWVNYHPQYGLSLNVDDVDPSFTLGDLQQRRMEILRRLKQEGILESNRQLPWAQPTQRIAVISAPGAAGYGDFIRQLLLNPRRLRFDVRLFPATMQGEQAPPTIISQLEAIAAEQERWDCVVVIRGGGASSDLLCFDNYDLAANIAAFPLPVIVGIGHDRDTTVLDYVAAGVVKTPTAAAELLLGGATQLLDEIDRCANLVYRIASQIVSGEKEHLSVAGATLPVVSRQAVGVALGSLQQRLLSLGKVSSRSITPRLARLDHLAEGLPERLAGVLSRQSERLDSREQLLRVLSPEATLARGYSITRVDGHALTDASQAPPGTTIETVLHQGTLTSVVGC